jgi:hypothetical protein
MTLSAVVVKRAASLEIRVSRFFVSDQHHKAEKIRSLKSVPF